MTDRDKAVQAAMDQLRKNFGAGSIMHMGERPDKTLDVIPTGSLTLDKALGVGGYPKGRLVEIFGPESSGKSTLALHAVANCQKAGGTVLYIDSEYSIDPIYASALGVDVDSLILCQPTTFEEAMEIALGMIKSGGIDLLVIDSIAALIPRAELDGDVGDATVGLVARLMSQTMRKMTQPLAEHNVCALFINQLRALIGNMGYGPSETTTGGKALRFYASVRVDVRRIATEKTGEDATGNRTKAKVVKNKCAAPLKIAQFSIKYGHGIDRAQEILDLGVESKQIIKSGSWFKLPDGTSIGQGAANACAWLVDNPVVAEGIVNG